MCGGVERGIDISGLNDHNLCSVDPISNDFLVA